MEGLENAARLLLGIIILSGIPVVMLFVLGYWLRGYRFRSTGEGRARGGIPIELAIDEEQDSAQARVRRSHCWQINHCPMVRRVNCPAYTRSYLPCWLAIQLAGYEQRHDCANCALYDLRKTAA